MGGRKLTQSQKKYIRQWIKEDPEISRGNDLSSDQWDILNDIHCTEVLWNEVDYYIEKLQEDK